MNLVDSSVIDIVIFIFKVLVAIGIVIFIISTFNALGELFPKAIGAVFSFIWKGFVAIGFQSSLWNLIPFMVVFVCGSTAILTYLLPSPNDPHWIWLEFAAVGILFFAITLSLNIYLKPKPRSEKWHVTPTPKEWPPTSKEWHVTPIPQTKIDADKLKTWREYK